VSDRIILHGIEFFAYGGVTEAERCIGQRYRGHVELELDLGEAARSDSIEHTVSYADVHRIVVDTAGQTPFCLIESLTERVLAAILSALPVQAVTVEIQKLLPPLDGVVEYAAVRLRREAATPRATSSFA